MSGTIICFEPLQIRDLRKTLHLTQAKFGKKVGCVTPGTVSRWENGDMRPSAAHSRKIAELWKQTNGRELAADTAADTTSSKVTENSADYIHPICRQIDMNIDSLERKKQFLIRCKECVNSQKGLSPDLEKTIQDALLL